MSGIIKRRVLAGVWWVEIPEADLRLLCGCPEDVVKHLIKGGLIHPIERDGVTYESGPNAILLSDVAVQSGSFASLAEFPVLQMLYRQGMILPGHPGNTGRKPLLIGREDQLTAQLQYIYRGNYGLVSAEELRRAGVPWEEAERLMLIKRRFAFGRIKPSRELLDTLAVTAQWTPITADVEIRRARLNVFEIRYGEACVSVDLNLAPGEERPPPYDLPAQSVKRAYFSVIHAGEGDGWDIHRGTMSSLICYQGDFYLIDAGPNIHHTLRALGVGLSEIKGVFHTHIHDDHFCGLTTLLRTGHKLRYYAVPMVRDSAARKLAALLSIERERFTEFFEVHDLELGVPNDVNGLEVTPLPSPHPVETTIFKFRCLGPDGWRSYGHFADITSARVLEGMGAPQGDLPGLPPEYIADVRATYLEPMDVKKVDVGGGLIHGDSEDFREDRSARLILAHTARALTLEERRFGSSAPFGTRDVLIAGKVDYNRERARAHLSSHVDGLSASGLEALLTCDLETYPPGAILLREGEIPEEVWLVIAGTIEALEAPPARPRKLNAGAMLCELAALDELPVTATYRALSFARVLRMPVMFYHAVLERDGLSGRIRELSTLRAALRASPLFDEGISQSTLSRLAQASTTRYLAAGEGIGAESTDRLYVALSEGLTRWIGDEPLGEVGAGDFFGVEAVLFGTASVLRVQAYQAAALLELPAEALGVMPIVRWKLLEDYKLRIDDISRRRSGTAELVWREEFSVGVQAIDLHHRRLFEIVNVVSEAWQRGSGAALGSALEALLEYTRYHFTAEELLAIEYDDPHRVQHQERHQGLVEQLLQVQSVVLGEREGEVDLLGFLRRWILDHVLGEDKKLGAHLNARGIY